MSKNPNIVFLGGGTGLSNLLTGAKKYPWNISAIVAMTDDGLSSGRLRKDFKTLPPGDIRKCLIALSQDSGLLAELFNYRFHRSKGLAGHSLGNLLILALEKITGSFSKAINEANKILATSGKVMPSTLDDIQLAGTLSNGKTITGERKLFLSGMANKIEKVWLTPDKVQANPDAIMAIKEADLIVIGPGSFYTSIIPNLLIKDITTAIIANKKAKKIYICNVSTERGETQNFTVDDHIRLLQNYSHKNIANYCVVNNKIISKSAKQHKLGEINNITTDKTTISGCKIVANNIINASEPLYHDPNKLAKIIYEISKK